MPFNLEQSVYDLFSIGNNDEIEDPICEVCLRKKETLTFLPRSGLNICPDCLEDLKKDLKELKNENKN